MSDAAIPPGPVPNLAPPLRPEPAASDEELARQADGLLQDIRQRLEAIRPCCPETEHVPEKLFSSFGKTLASIATYLVAVGYVLGTAYFSSYYAALLPSQPFHYSLAPVLEALAQDMWLMLALLFPLIVIIPLAVYRFGQPDRPKFLELSKSYAEMQHFARHLRRRAKRNPVLAVYRTQFKAIDREVRDKGVVRIRSWRRTLRDIHGSRAPTLRAAVYLWLTLNVIILAILIAFEASGENPESTLGQIAMYATVYLIAPAVAIIFLRYLRILDLITVLHDSTRRLVLYAVSGILLVLVMYSLAVWLGLANGAMTAAAYDKLLDKATITLSDGKTRLRGYYVPTLSQDDYFLIQPVGDQAYRVQRIAAASVRGIETTGRR